MILSQARTFIISENPLAPDEAGRARSPLRGPNKIGRLTGQGGWTRVAVPPRVLG
jgi:hypothetical protein